VLDHPGKSQSNIELLYTILGLTYSNGTAAMQLEKRRNTKKMMLIMLILTNEIGT